MSKNVKCEVAGLRGGHLGGQVSLSFTEDDFILQICPSFVRVLCHFTSGDRLLYLSHQRTHLANLSTFYAGFLSFTLQGPLLALRPPQPQRAPAAQHRLLQARLLLPHHRLDLPRHRRRRHHHHQADRDHRLAG